VNNRAVLYKDLGNVTDVIDHEEVDFSNVGSAWAYNNRGVLFKKHGKIDNALYNYNKAIEISPSLALLYHNRGALYAHMNNMEAYNSDMKTYSELMMD